MGKVMQHDFREVQSPKISKTPWESAIEILLELKSR